MSLNALSYSFTSLFIFLLPTAPYNIRKFVEASGEPCCKTMLKIIHESVNVF